MGWVDWLMLVVYGLTCFNVGYVVTLHNSIIEKRRELARMHDQAALMLADATEKYKVATGKINALNEAVVLWNYGAREEALETLKAVGVAVR